MSDEIVAIQSRKEAYHAQMEAQLKEGIAKIGQLQAKAEQAEARTRVSYYEVLDQLRDKQESLLRKVHGLKQVGAGVWREMKAGVDHAWVDLQAAFERASDRMK